jgi:hypothetical protein
MTLPLEAAPSSPNTGHRRSFIGGSDARIIMGTDAGALNRLWREKRGEAEPPDYSDNLLVQLGVATEPLNRRWFEKTTGERIRDVQSWIRHPVIRWMAATLEHRRGHRRSEAKFMLPWSFSEEVAAEKHIPSSSTTCGSAMPPRQRSRSSPAAAKPQGRPAADVLRSGFRRRTPGPPPFSAINRMPAASSASRMRARASSDTFGPVPVSTRLTVGSDIPARLASCDWDHPSRPRAARICSRVITSIIFLIPFGSSAMIQKGSYES